MAKFHEQKHTSFSGLRKSAEPLCTMRQATVKPYNQLTKSTNLTKKISKFEANNRYRKL